MSRPTGLALALATIVALAAARAPAGPPGSWQDDVLRAREAVWRDFFARPDSLAAVLTDDFIAMERDGPAFRGKQETVEVSRYVVGAGTRLARLEFPETRIQRYGDVVIIYTTYRMVLNTGGTDGPAQSGRATEFFRWDGTRWLHTGWHLSG